MVGGDVLLELESLGSEQTRKIYKRHGVGEPLYGVSYANLKSLAKRIKIDHALALALWESGNHDARVLATMIADPGQMTESLLDDWAGDLACYPLTDAFVGLGARTPYARSKMEEWTQSDEEYIGAAGWQLLAGLAAHDMSFPDSYFEHYLGIIEHDIDTRKNRVRYSMNAAVITIGIRNPALQEKAIGVARKIRHVKVDHGETNCKSPDAEAYILKTLAWRRKKGA
ncbi:MAG: DNA alkylation repair protein [Chloroflexia bacterium]